MDELINFDALGDIVVNLTNKLAECVGWIVNRETPKKLAVSTYTVSYTHLRAHETS